MSATADFFVVVQQNNSEISDQRMQQIDEAAFSQIFVDTCVQKDNYELKGQVAKQMKGVSVIPRILASVAQRFKDQVDCEDYKQILELIAKHQKNGEENRDIIDMLQHNEQMIVELLVQIRNQRRGVAGGKRSTARPPPHPPRRQSRVASRKPPSSPARETPKKGKKKSTKKPPQASSNSKR